MGLLVPEERWHIVELLSQLPHVDDPGVRALLLSDLPLSVRGAVPHIAAPVLHLHQIVTSLDGPVDSDIAQLTDGTWPIIPVLERAEELVAGSALAQSLAELIGALRVRAASRG